jgi:2-polyprenyl-3-methyl-5-hydroxy-6-metoxy-1,4-benzoquinol methylase
MHILKKIKKLKKIPETIDRIQDSLKKLNTIQDSLKKLDTIQDSLKKLNTIQDSLKKLDTIQDSLKKLDTIQDSLKKLDTIQDSLKKLNTIRDSLEKLDRINKKFPEIKELVASIRSDLALTAIRDLAKDTNIEFDVDINTESISDIKFLDRVFEVEMQKNKKLLNKILAYKDPLNKRNIGENDERGLPTNANFISRDYYRTMLKRYFFAAKIFAENKIVLDSCSGVGWGTYILANYAKHVIAYDYNEEAIKLAKNDWKAKNIKWKVVNALNVDKSFKDESFDVITAMETLEHFTQEDGIKYIIKHKNLLKDKGIFIGTSIFPKTRKSAEKSPALLDNKFHLFLWTKDEIEKELNKHFSIVKIVNSWMFIAQK